MKIGLIDADSRHFPNLALMKLSAWHKARGDTVEWWWGFGEYDRVYISKVFDETYTPDIPEPFNAKEIIKGGTGYGLDNKLPVEIEHIYPDYSLYPTLTKDTAYGFLTRGCFRACDFCAVSTKEGDRSVKVADLSEWWQGQRKIKLLDPNLLACPEHAGLLEQLVNSGAYVDFTQGLDIRLLDNEDIADINAMRIAEIHFAWDSAKEDLSPFFRRYAERATHRPHGRFGTVYVLTNYNSTLAEDLFRIYTLRDLNYDPYVMVYNKPAASKEIRALQRWCNNRKLFGACRRFEDFTQGLNFNEK